LARWLWTSEGPVAPMAGVILMAVLVGTFVIATASGVPVGPHSEPEKADLVRILVTIGQLGTLLLLLATMRGRRRRWAFNTILLAGVALWILRLTGALG
jgi:peptidoglycan/LPS O-acetylase OafA/YrhL